MLHPGAFPLWCHSDESFRPGVHPADSFSISATPRHMQRICSPLGREAQHRGGHNTRWGQDPPWSRGAAPISIRTPSFYRYWPGWGGPRLPDGAAALAASICLGIGPYVAANPPLRLPHHDDVPGPGPREGPGRRWPAAAPRTASTAAGRATGAPAAGGRRGGSGRRCAAPPRTAAAWAGPTGSSKRPRVARGNVKRQVGREEIKAPAFFYPPPGTLGGPEGHPAHRRKGSKPLHFRLAASSGMIRLPPTVWGPPTPPAALCRGRERSGWGPPARGGVGPPPGVLRRGLRQNCGDAVDEEPVCSLCGDGP